MQHDLNVHRNVHEPNEMNDCMTKESKEHPHY